MLNRIRTSVINLDKFIDNYNLQKLYLENIGLNCERFSAINANNDEHHYHDDKLTFFSKNFTPKSVIGCSMSHIMLAEKLYKEEILNHNSKINYFLIMEDDCFPIEKYNSQNAFKKILKTTINDIDILDPEWDIIQLHSDALWPTYETYQTHFFCGSTAAYVLSKKGLCKMVKEKVTSHIDFITQNFIKYNKYRSRYNIFYTDETNSLQRIKYNLDNLFYYTLSVKTYLLILINKYSNILELRGQKSYSNFLEFNILKLPYFKKEYTANECIDYLIVLIIINKLYNYNK